jgi:hypothetical protein
MPQISAQVSINYFLDEDLPDEKAEGKPNR